MCNRLSGIWLIARQLCHGVYLRPTQLGLVEWA